MFASFIVRVLLPICFCFSVGLCDGLPFQDIDCMPLNPVENMPALLGRQAIYADRFFENSNQLTLTGRAQELMKLCPGDMVDNADGISQLSPAKPASLLKQTKA